MKWIDVNDELPVIPEGKHGVSVLVSVHDPVYEEISPGNGSDTQSGIYDGTWFKTIGYGGKNFDFIYFVDMITHWMYKPEAVQIPHKETVGKRWFKK